ncbi:vesicle-inducing protein [Gracilaria domingensis]|nr:vesicle-inducing protein [Gracilaria domingensis]
MSAAYVVPIRATPLCRPLNASSFTGQRVRTMYTNPPVRRARPPHSPSTSIQMNLIDRFFRVVRANLNQVVSGMEDPEKVLNQTVTDMQNDLVKVRQAYAEVSATLKRIERQREQASTTSTEWKKRAQMALQKGEEDLAREALMRKKTADEQEASLAAQINGMKANVDKLYTSMQQLESKISEARAKKDQYVARARTAKTSQKVNDMLGNVSTSGGLEAFERMKAKVEELEVKADVSRELSLGGSADVSLESKFKALESDSVDDELQKMKNQLSGTSPFQLKGSYDPEVEGELEKMKKNM